VPSSVTTGRSPPQRRHDRERFRAARDLHPLLRCSHLFAATVHELLQREPLERSTPHALTPSQSNLLRVICMDGKHPVGRVAVLLGISTPAATKTIDKLERLGLVVRHPCGGDRRTRLFSVSPAGRALVRRYERRIAARLRAALKGFAPGEVDAFVRLLKRFSVSLLAGEPAGGKSCLRCAAYVDKDCPVGQARGGCPCDEFFSQRWAAAAIERGAGAGEGNAR
jgi:MarR family 2-MHQ and catechol resistance regulon transcriptional repressor